MQVSKFLGWEIHLPDDFALRRKPFGLKVLNTAGQEVAEAAVSLNRAVVVDVLSPVRLDIQFNEQRIIINPQATIPVHS